MRRVALTRLQPQDIRRVILHDVDSGVFLYLSDSVEDVGTLWDRWYLSVADAEAEARERFGIEAADWIDVPDPLPGCFHDWIAPVRPKSQADGVPPGRRLERLVDGVWVDLPDD